MAPAKYCKGVTTSHLVKPASSSCRTTNVFQAKRGGRKAPGKTKYQRKGARSIESSIIHTPRERRLRHTSIGCVGVAASAKGSETRNGCLRRRECRMYFQHCLIFPSRLGDGRTRGDEGVPCFLLVVPTLCLHALCVQSRSFLLYRFLRH